MQQRFPIVALSFLETMEDGSTVVREMNLDTKHELGYVKFLSSDSGKQEFWMASDRSDMTDGDCAIASCIPGGDVDPELDADRTNTMIGMIRDKVITVFGIYKSSRFGIVS